MNQPVYPCQPYSMISNPNLYERDLVETSAKHISSLSSELNTTCDQNYYSTAPEEACANLDKLCLPQEIDPLNKK